MKGFPVEAHFHDLEEYNGDFFFSAVSFNGLFRVEKENRRAHFVGCFQQEDEWEWNLHRKIIAFQDSLFFIPLSGRGITIYSPKNDTFDFISISDRGEEKAQFADTVDFEPDYRVLLVPQRKYTHFCVLDLMRKELVTLDWIDRRINTEIEGINDDEWERFSAHGAFFYNDHLYIARSDSNIVYKVNLEKKVTEELVIPYDVHIRSMTKGKRRFCFTLKENKLLYYYFDENKWMLKDIPFDCSDDQYPYVAVFEYEGIDVVIPAREDKLIICSDNDGWQVIDLLSELERTYDKTALFYDFKFADGKLYMFPRAANGILVYDFKTQKSELIKIMYDDAFMKRLAGRWSETNFKGEAIFENADYTLKEYLLGVEYGIPV